jgi:bacterial/archaeal transporter family-2 protein
MFYLLVVGAGISVALQQVLNANLRMELGSPWWAGFVSYLVGTIFMLAIATMSDQPWLSTAMIARTSWISWAGGFFGAIFIGTAIFMVPRLGAASVLALIVVGQMIGSLAFDHFWLVWCSPACGKSGPARGRSLSRSRRDLGPFLIDDASSSGTGASIDSNLLGRPQWILTYPIALPVFPRLPAWSHTSSGALPGLASSSLPRRGRRSPSRSRKTAWDDFRWRRSPRSPASKPKLIRLKRIR